MGLWRYKAIELQTSTVRSGELAGDSAAEVRGSLRRIGLQVIDLRPIRTVETRASLLRPVHQALERHLRRRRRGLRAELDDGLATLLEAGMPLLEAVDTLIAAKSGRRLLGGDARRTMLVQVRESLRSGDSLDQAMTHHPTWFDSAEIAMVRAGQHSGQLPGVLRSLALRHEHADELGQKLLGALAYPALVSLIGIGVVIFLSVKILPDLTQILHNADLTVPRITEIVMAIGQFVAGWWHVILLTLLFLPFILVLILQFAAARGYELPSLRPRVMRRMAVANMSLQLTELLRAGVPAVEAIRVIAPTVNATLGALLTHAADRIERGESLSDALSDHRWFDPEFRRLVRIGESSGELDELLERIGHRYARQTRRLMDRLASILEPTVIIILAVLIGIVVIASVLPLVRLKDLL